MARVLLLSDADTSRALPALALLGHDVTLVHPSPAALMELPECDVALLDCRQDLAGARSLCQLLHSTGRSAPLIAIFTAGGLAAISAAWQVDDIILDTAGPAETEARLRLATGRSEQPEDDEPIRAGALTIDEHAYAAKVRGRPLDLTYKEFELLKYLAQHPGRAHTRAQLLHEVWGYDYYGGTRTVDVHIRRLRAKLGPEHEALIGTVRNVGYRFTEPV